MPFRVLATWVLCLAFAGLSFPGVARGIQDHAPTMDAHVVAAGELQIGPVVTEEDHLASRTVVDGLRLPCAAPSTFANLHLEM